MQVNLKEMADAPRGGGKHIVAVTNWDQVWVVAWDGRAEGWRHVHGENDCAADDYFKGWMPYHGELLWPQQQDVA